MDINQLFDRMNGNRMGSIVLLIFRVSAEINSSDSPSQLTLHLASCIPDSTNQKKNVMSRAKRHCQLSRDLVMKKKLYEMEVLPRHLFANGRCVKWTQIIEGGHTDRSCYD